MTRIGVLSGYCEGLKLSRNWIKNEMSITHGTTPKLREITDITKKKMKKMNQRKKERNLGTSDFSGAKVSGCNWC